MSKLCPVCSTTYADTLVFCPADGTTLRAADLAGDLIGSVIADRYLVTDMLGEGGMGTVYLARHVRLPQQAAIKVLRKDMLRDGAAVARFNREAANASRIDHDRVCRVYDFGETDDGTVYLAMEYVQGKTLRAMTQESGPMLPARAADIVRQIADGLDAAHRMGIVHRDLKPDNILVIEDADGDLRVKIVDFGIAKAFGNDDAGAGGGHGLTKTGMVVGTPEFMSPEQLLGHALDARSDIYALAIVAYQCLTGELPFANDTPDHGMTARLMAPPRPLVSVLPAVHWPPPVQRVFDQGLARQPADRPASAGAFARGLSTALEAWEAENKEGTTRPVPSAIGTAPVLRATPTPEALAWKPGESTPPVIPPPAPVAPVSGAGNRSSLAIVAGIVAVLAVVGGGAFYATRSHATHPAHPADSVALAAAATTASGAQTPGGATPPAPTPAASNAPAPSTPLPGAPAVPNASAANGRAPSGPAAPVTRPAGSAPSAAERAPVVTATSASVRHTMDSIATALESGDETAGRAADPAIRALLPRLATADDSTWAYIHLFEAHMLFNDAQRGCTALRSARSLARTQPQRDAVHKYESLCGL